MVKKERLVETFLKLATINSPYREERDVADVLEADLRALGFEVLRDRAGDQVGGNTGNVIATKKGTVEGAVPIMLNAHMDTVSPTIGWSYVTEDETVRSGGDTILGADDKAGIAAIMEAMMVVSEDGIHHGDIQVVFTMGEEVGLIGAKYLDYELITSRCAFAFDGGRPVGYVVIAAPTQDNLLAKIHGKAAHAGAKPESGINAIVVASKAIAKMKLGRIDPETTANIGIISGGTARNIIPEFCEVKGEARSRDPQKLDVQVRHMVEAFRQAAAEMGASVDVEIERSYVGYRLSERDEVVQLAVGAARRAGIDPQMRETGGGSDANLFNAKGLPTTVIGVGYENPHSTEEYIPIPDLVKAAEMAVEIVKMAATQRSI